MTVNGFSRQTTMWLIKEMITLDSNGITTHQMVNLGTELITRMNRFSNENYTTDRRFIDVRI